MSIYKGEEAWARKFYFVFPNCEALPSNALEKKGKSFYVKVQVFCPVYAP